MWFTYTTSSNSLIGSLGSFPWGYIERPEKFGTLSEIVRGNGSSKFDTMICGRL